MKQPRYTRAAVYSTTVAYTNGNANNVGGDCLEMWKCYRAGYSSVIMGAVSLHSGWVLAQLLPLKCLKRNYSLDVLLRIINSLSSGIYTERV